MEIKIMKIGELKPNKKNPRIIKDDKFKLLVKSIEDFPGMLNVRPIVVDKNMMVLGGNQRLKASKEAGLKEVPVIIVKEWTEKQEREFILKDNLSSGDWDMEMLLSDWDEEELTGFELTKDDIEESKNPENEETECVFATELDKENNYIVLKFDSDIDFIQAKTLFGLKTETGRRANGKEWSSGIGRVLNGVEAIKKIQDES